MESIVKCIRWIVNYVIGLLSILLCIYRRNRYDIIHQNVFLCLFIVLPIKTPARLSNCEMRLSISNLINLTFRMSKCVFVNNRVFRNYPSFHANITLVFDPLTTSHVAGHIESGDNRTMWLEFGVADSALCAILFWSKNLILSDVSSSAV